MARSKKLGHGCTVSIGGTAFGMVRKFKMAKLSRGKTDTTTFDDSVEMALDNDPINAGEIEFEVVYDPEDAAEATIDNILVNDDVTERETSIVFKIRKTGTGTSPAASTWTYTTITYTCRIYEADPVEVDSKTLFARRIKAFNTALPVKS